LLRPRAGVLILAQRNRRWRFSLRKIVGLGLLSAFNSIARR